MINLRPFPHFFQLSSNDCGHTCLQIICKYYGKFFDIEHLKKIVGYNKKGTTAYDLVKAAEKLGFRSLPFSVSYYKFRTLVPLPCIIHWEGCHFVVVYKVTMRHVYISDPAIGLRRLSISEFLKGWLRYNGSNNAKRGSVVVMEITPSFYEEKSTDLQSNYIQGLIYVWNYIRNYKESIGHILIIALLISLVNSIFPILTQSIIDTGIPTHDYNFITLLLISTIVLGLSVAIADWIQQSIILHFSTRVKVRMIADYISKLFKLPITYFESHLMGDIIQRNIDFDRIETSIITSVFGAIFGCIALVVFGTLLLVYNHILFAIYLSFSAVYILWIIIFWSIRKRLDVKFFTYLSINQSQWIEMLSKIADIKNFNYGQHKRWQWEKNQVKIYKSRIKLLHIEQIQKFGGTSINTIKDALLIFFAAKLVISGDMTIGMLISVQYIIGQLSLPLSSIVSFITSSQLGYISYLRVTDVDKITPEKFDLTDNEDMLDLTNDVKLNNLSFRYDINSDFVLKNISFNIPAGKVVALVGESGSGKSTLIKMLANLYTPTFGDIRVGNIKLTSLSCQIWREHCGVLLQESGLMKGSIYDNIIFGRPYDKDKLIQSVNIANIKKEIENMPSAYDTMIGENGQGVSEGQKQRILFARAIYHEPKILLLDELTSSLDSKNEYNILANIKQYFKHQTIVISAHRLATVKNADVVVLLKGGRIVASGNHAVLYKTCDEYKRLFENQI